MSGDICPKTLVALILYKVVLKRNFCDTVTLGFKKKNGMRIMAHHNVRRPVKDNMKKKHGIRVFWEHILKSILRCRPSRLAGVTSEFKQALSNLLF